jgi:cytochrome b
VASGADRQHVWDLPTRLFHWALVILLAFSWWSAENFEMEWHRRSGLAVVGRLLFRNLWGIFGTNTSRFGQFVRGPGAVLSYLRPSQSEQRVAIGHNPLGGWSVIIMLLLLGVQTVSGLFAVDVDGIESGPLSYLVDFDQGRVAAGVHDLTFTLLQVVIVLHVVAVLFYLVVKRRNLIGPMITGFRRVPDGAPSQSATLAPRWRLAAALIIAAVAVYGVANGLRF